MPRAGKRQVQSLDDPGSRPGGPGRGRTRPLHASLLFSRRERGPSSKDVGFRRSRPCSGIPSPPAALEAYVGSQMQPALSRHGNLLPGLQGSQLCLSPSCLPSSPRRVWVGAGKKYPPMRERYSHDVNSTREDFEALALSTPGASGQDLVRVRETVSSPPRCPKTPIVFPPNASHPFLPPVPSEFSTGTTFTCGPWVQQAWSEKASLSNPVSDF
jgi:hypothetical protein